jgi:hypothetical protein
MFAYGAVDVCDPEPDIGVLMISALVRRVLTSSADFGPASNSARTVTAEVADNGMLVLGGTEENWASLSGERVGRAVELLRLLYDAAFGDFGFMEMEVLRLKVDVRELDVLK